jgi:hypothetical protein
MIKSSLLFLAILLVGCAGRVGDVDAMVAGEAQKLRSVEIGMTISQVEAAMGSTPLIFNAGTDVEVSSSRPIRVDKFKAKDGKAVSIFYYRSSTKRRDNVTTDDETTAVVFVDGKVDALLPGEKSKEVIEVRFR